MSEQPLVCCVMLTRDRPEMAKRAVECFRAQTYENKMLLIYDTSPLTTFGFMGGVNTIDGMYFFHSRERVHALNGESIGVLRNNAIELARRKFDADIIAHADDDDWSNSNRLAEQVMLLQASGADCVGYSDMLFWRHPGVCDCDPGPCVGPKCGLRGEAWLYLGPQKALGTSLCYWRRTHELHPFPDQPRPGFSTGEEVDWIRHLNLKSVSSFGEDGQPRMVASIHGKNTSGSYRLIECSDSWRRTPEHDSLCAGLMAL